MSQSLRFNMLDIERFDSADDGKSGVLTAIVRHPGVLRYAEPGGTYRGELVTKEFNRKLDSAGLPLVSEIAGKAATNEHIPVRFDGSVPVVSPHEQVGKVREDGVHVYTDGRVRVTMDVEDPQTISEIASGKKKGLSLAYLCSTERKDGVHNGRPYQYIQTDPLKVHHVAIVDNPRAPEATFLNFKYDSADTTDIAWQVDSVEPPQSASAETTSQPTGKKPMAYTLTIGNRPIVLDSADDAAAINAMLAENSTLKTKLDAKKKASEADDEDDENDEDDEDDEDDDLKDKNGKPLPAFIRNKMKKKNDAIAELTDRLDSLTTEVETKDGELAVLQTLVSRADSEETEHLDADAIAEAVQSRLDSLFETYNDAKEYLPADFKLDGTTTVASIQAAALQSLDADFKLDSDEGIAGAYATMKRWTRKDSGVQLERLAIASSAPANLTRNDAAVTTKTTKKPLTFMKKNKGAC